MLNEQELKALVNRADQSDVKAMIKLADYYRNEGIYDKAFKYVHKSTLYSSAEGERKLGYYYEKGIGCEKDMVKARQYYELAAMHGDIKAKYNIGLFYYKNKQYPQAFNLVKESADANYGKALVLLGYLYEHAINGEVDYKSAKECYEKALDLGEKDLYHRLGQYAYYGYGEDVDYQTAFSYFYSGANEDEKECFYFLGVMFSKGEGVKKDLKQAFHYYQQGALAGDVRAMYNLAIYYENGISVPQDLEKAKYWLKKSADGGFDLAINKLQIENI